MDRSQRTPFPHSDWLPTTRLHWKKDGEVLPLKTEVLIKILNWILPIFKLSLCFVTSAP